MNILPIILIDGIAFASWLFLVSAGITFIFGVLRILNVAHGSLYAVGAYLGATFVLQLATATAAHLDYDSAAPARGRRGRD